MADSPTDPIVEKARDVIVPAGFPDEVYKSIRDGLKPQAQRGIVFEDRKHRNAAFISKGLTKPGKISYDTLRRAANSVHVVRICINVLKEKITKTKWVIKSKDPLKQANEEEVKRVTALLDEPNQNSETFRSLMDKILEDLLVLDAVSIEKTRFPDGELAELYFVDSATIRPVFDEYGNQDVEIPLKTKNEGDTFLPVSYVQVLDNSQYGGPESGEIIAAWPKKDFIHFHMHPQGSMEGYGYGLSPLEGVLSVVANLLNADNYNSTYFEEGSFPPMILQLVGQVNQRDLEAYREYLIQELTGNFHRPAIMAGTHEAKVLDLKADSNRDMQFMEYTIFLAKLMCAAMGLSPQDIGLTDSVGSKNVAEEMSDLSDKKGYSSILDLVKSIINSQIIWHDFGFNDIEFDWVAEDSLDPSKAELMYDQGLKNGTYTINEVREKKGMTPFGDWADKPMLLSASEGYVPLESSNEELQEDEAVMNGEKPYEEQATDEIEGTAMEKMRKAVFAGDTYKTWMDDRGYSQPFIYMNILSGTGQVIKPPVAVNLQSQELEMELTSDLAARGLNVKPVRKMTYVEVRDMLEAFPDVLVQFEKYVAMTEEYDSEKWRSKFGGSRKFAYYLVSEYIDGYNLSNPLLLADMKRDPESYRKAVVDLARLWRVEKEMVLGDRRPDQYIIGHDKRAYGIDYQFRGDKDRWLRSKNSVKEALETIPELRELFLDRIDRKDSLVKQIIKRMVR